MIVEILLIGGSWNGEYLHAPVDDGYPIYQVRMPPRMPMPLIASAIAMRNVEPERLTLETYELKVIATQTKFIRYEYHYLYTN